MERAVVCHERLGAVGIALLPVEKLKQNSRRGIPFEREIHDFLISRFNGYTVSSGNISGHWKDGKGRDYYGEHREYKIPISDALKLSEFEAFLARIGGEMGEQCIYAEIGAEARLIYSTTVE
jgi:hypothetical protein